MSIATEIARLQQAKADLKTAIEGKGVTVPARALLDDYAALVGSISGGSTVSGDKQMIADGTYDVSDKATATYIWPMPFRAYINVANSYWAYYNDSSTSFCFMIEPGKTYTLKWDSDVAFNLYRVAFTKTTDAPSTNSTSASYRRNVFKADGTEGLEQNGFESELTFKITDSSLKMCVIQIQGTTTIWNTGTVFAWFEEIMQHLTITVE